MKKMIAVFSAFMLIISIGTTAFAGANSVSMNGSYSEVAVAYANVDGYLGYASTLPVHGNIYSYVTASCYGRLPSGQNKTLYDSNSATSGPANISFNFGTGGAAMRINSTHTCSGVTVSLTTY